MGMQMPHRFGMRKQSTARCKLCYLRRCHYYWRRRRSAVDPLRAAPNPSTIAKTTLSSHAKQMDAHPHYDCCSQRPGGGGAVGHWGAVEGKKQRIGVQKGSESPFDLGPLQTFLPSSPCRALQLAQRNIAASPPSPMARRRGGFVRCFRGRGRSVSQRRHSQRMQQRETALRLASARCVLLLMTQRMGHSSVLACAVAAVPSRPKPPCKAPNKHCAASERALECSKKEPLLAVGVVRCRQ